MKIDLPQFKDRLAIAADLIRAYGAIFLPSVSLVTGGITIFVRPDLILSVIAMFCIVLGTAVGYATWKLVVARERFHDFIEKFDGRIFIEGLRVQGEDLSDPVDPDDDPDNQLLH